MIGQIPSGDLEDDSHVVRYARPSALREDGTVSGEVFQLRDQEPYLSVNWLEYFEGCSKEQQLREVIQLIRLELKATGHLAKVHVSSTIHHVQERLDDLRIVHCPLEADEKYKADPSHSGIVGLPPAGSPEAELIGDLIAQCVNETFLCSDIGA